MFSASKPTDDTGKSRGWKLKQLLTAVRATRLAAIHEQLTDHFKRHPVSDAKLRIVSLRIDPHGEIFERDVYPAERIARAMHRLHTMAVTAPGAKASQVLADLEGLSDPRTVRRLRGKSRKFAELGKKMFFLIAEFPFRVGKPSKPSQ